MDAAPRDSSVTIATQDDEHKPFTVTIEWGDGESPDRLNWPDRRCSASSGAARRIADDDANGREREAGNG